MSEQTAESPQLRPSLVDSAERALRAWMAPGRFRVGERLPTEQELAGMLGVSRGTLRGALERLERAGEIVRRQGSGTFVARGGSPVGPGLRALRVVNFSANARQLGIEVADIHVGRGPFGPEAVAGLGVDEGTEGITIERTVMVDGRPAYVAHDSLMPESALPELAEIRRSLQTNMTIYEFLLDVGVEVAFSRTVIAPILLDAAHPVGQVLGLVEPAACLEIRETLFDGRDRAVLWARDLRLPGRLEVEVVQRAASTAPVSLAVPS